MTTILALLALLSSIVSPTPAYDALPECSSDMTVIQNCYWTESLHPVELDSDFWVDSDFGVHWVGIDKADTTLNYSWLDIAPGTLPCENEDSAGPCYWDAKMRGNGEGRSFTVTAAQEVIYW